jgi:hypothetical protein
LPIFCRFGRFLPFWPFFFPYFHLWPPINRFSLLLDWLSNFHNQLGSTLFFDLLLAVSGSTWPVSPPMTRFGPDVNRFHLPWPTDSLW